MKFETTDELIEQAEKDGACRQGIDWCRGEELQEVLETIPNGYRVWCLQQGYEQFAEHLTGVGWRVGIGRIFCVISHSLPSTAIGASWMVGIGLVF